MYCNRNSIYLCTFISCHHATHSFIPVLHAILGAVTPSVLLWPAAKYTVLCVLLDGELLYLCAEGLGLTVMASFCGCFKLSL